MHRKRICEKHGCNEMIPASEFLCPLHWQNVPQPLHEKLMRTWETYLDVGTDEALKLAGAAYRAARSECIDAANNGTVVERT